MSQYIFIKLLKTDKENLIFDKMSQLYEMDELTKLFSYDFIFDKNNIEKGWKWSYLLQQSDLVEYLSRLSRTVYTPNVQFYYSHIYKFMLPDIEKKGYELFFEELNGNYSFFEDVNIDFNFYYLPIKKVPLNFIKRFMDRNWDFKSLGMDTSTISKKKMTGLSGHMSLTAEFVEEYIDSIYILRGTLVRSIWDFNILLERGICTPDIMLTLYMMDGTAKKVEVPNYFPIHSLDFFIDKDNTSYFVKGKEEPLDKDMKVSKLETTGVFVLFT